MPPQTTGRVLMIRPAAFGFNSETATSNTFQQDRDVADAFLLAVTEFDRFVEVLRMAGLVVEVVQDVAPPIRPDAVFPNNWVSFHAGGRAILYPMANSNRRAEVRPEILEQLGYNIFLDLRIGAGARSLEGTGSLVLDRLNSRAYGCLSPRTDESLLVAFSEAMGYAVTTFRASVANVDIYHTNVVMALGEHTAIVCLEAVASPRELAETLTDSGHEILPISLAQLHEFAGNMLLLEGSKGKFWAMSERARQSLTSGQIAVLEREGPIVAAPIPTIETLGGGSARCMIAELF